MERISRREALKTGSQLKDLGVKFIAPSHCTGREAIEIFSTIYGRRFINSGVGLIITANDFI